MRHETLNIYSWLLHMKIIATQQETFGLKSDETCKGGQQCILELMLEWRQFLKYVHRQIVHCRDSGLGSN